MAEEASSSVETTNTETTETQPEVVRSFSQADVDRIVKERLARAKAEPPADYEELKAAKAKLDELEAANSTELEKAQKRLADMERKTADAEARAQENLLRAQVVAEAARKNVVDPDAAVALLDRSLIEFDQDGSPKNIAQAMDSLLEAKPYLVAASGGTRGSADQGARQQGGPKQLARSELQHMTPEQISKAVDEGRADSLLSGASS